MRSHLTRNVYHRVLAGRALSQPCRALSSSASLLRASNTFRPRILVRRPSRRTFLGLFKKPPRELKQPELEPGYITLLQFTSHEKNNLRPPPRWELAKGFRTFFEHKARGGQPVNSTQAYVTTPLLRYLLDYQPKQSNADDAFESVEDPRNTENAVLTLQDLRLARDVTLKQPRGVTENHLTLSRELYAAIKGKLQAAGQEAGPEASPEDFDCYIRALTQYGASVEASERLAKYVEHNEAKSAATRKLWLLVLRGFAVEGREEELQAAADWMRQRGVRFGSVVHEVFVTFFAKRDNVAETKRWFEKPIHDSKKPTATTYKEILHFALRNDQKDWVQAVFDEAMKTSYKKDTWDVALQWLVLGMNKGPDEIRETVWSLLARISPAHREGLVPDTNTINGLIEMAVLKKDPYLAERFITLGMELGVQPNGKTHLLQLAYRIEARDFSGAQAMYKKLQAGEMENDEDLPVINAYIRALCSISKPEVDRILEITSAIEQRSLALEPETTLMLCKMLLLADKQYDVIDTLTLHTVQYSLEDRALVRRGFVQYCLDETTSTARVWDAYSLLRQFFPETNAEERVQLMDAFFARNRPDMACHVFGHMRAHQNTAMRPTADIYARCLESIGRHPDAESLQMVHNMLKMDMTMQMNTKLYNALMLAYTGCDDAPAALDFWTNITNSAEGPTYNSLAIVFSVCEALPHGDRQARLIWQKLQKMDLEVPPLVYGSYCAAIASEGHMNEVKELVNGMEASVGCAPDMPLLGHVYNAFPASELKKEYAIWARARYPSAWAELQKTGRKTSMDGLPRFNVAWDLQP